MPEVKDVLREEGWGQASEWRGFHYFVATGEDASTDPAQPVPLAISLCGAAKRIVPDDGFWPVPPSSVGQDGEGFGACDICRLASGARPWAKKDAMLPLVDGLRALRTAMGPEAVRDITFNFHGQITPEVVADALGQLERQAANLHSKWARAERMLAVYELAKEGLAFLIESDAEPSDTFAAGVVEALLKSKGVKL